MTENREALSDRGERHRWTIKPETLVADNGAEITMGLAYGPVLEVETVVCPVEEMILQRGEAARLRRGNMTLREALDGLARYAGCDLDCNARSGAPECSCGFDEMYTRIRALMRDESPLPVDEEDSSHA